MLAWVCACAYMCDSVEGIASTQNIIYNMYIHAVGIYLYVNTHVCKVVMSTAAMVYFYVCTRVIYTFLYIKT